MLDNYADMPVWLRWKLAPHPATGKPVKTPYRLDRIKRGWKAGRGTRAEAEASTASGKWSGIGIVLGEPTKAAGTILCGLDLDSCLDILGNAAAWAQPVIDAFATRTEISPSGDGLKLYFRVRLDDVPIVEEAIRTAGRQTWKRGGGEHPPGMELYLRNRWFAVTDELLPGTTPEVRTIPRAVLLTLIQKTGPTFAGRKTSGRSEHAIGVAARVKRNGGSLEGFEEAIDDDPIAAEWAADHDQRQIDRAYARSGLGAVELGDMKGMGLNEDNLALAFAVKYKDQLHYDHDTHLWHIWRGGYWRPNTMRLAFHWTREMCRDVRLKNAANKAAAMLAKRHTAENVEVLAQRDPTLAVTSEIWDRDPWLLGTPDGTVDLRTGELREARQDDMITKITVVAPVADFHPLDCPVWFTFLEEITRRDRGLMRFLQQWCGYCLTGSVGEHALVFIYGPGGNGKTVFLNTIARILGDYACTAPMATFAASGFDRHPTEIARLRGARLVTASETEEGRAWNETRVKQLTGGDRIAARFMNQNFF